MKTSYINPDIEAIRSFIRDHLTAGMSQAEIAKRANLEPSSISHYLRNKNYFTPSLYNLCKLADGLGYELVLQPKKGGK